MKPRVFLASCLLVLLMTGCWPKSVHPFYQPRDVIFDSALLGTWSESPKPSDKDETWTFSQERGNTYRVIFRSDERELSFDGHLFRLGNVHLLDLYSRNRAVCDVPAHTLLRVTKVNNSLELRLLNPDWIKKRLSQQPNSLKHIRVHDPEHPEDPEKGEFVLTAETKALQKFLRRHLSDEELFGDPTSLVKR